MKTKTFIAGILLTATLAVAQIDRLTVAPGTPVVLTATATNDLVIALQRGLFEEEGNRDLDAAISAYQSLGAQFDKSRQVAATAIFRLGECYRKLGRTNEAVAQYDRIVREFSDQQTLAILSRQNLAGLGVNRSVISPTRTSDMKLLEKLKNLAGYQLEQVLPTLVPDNILTTLIQERNSARQNLVKLEHTVTKDHPDYKNQVEVVNELDNQIVQRIDGILFALELRATTARPVLESLDFSATNGVSANSTVTDDEEKEIRRIQTMIQNSPDLINAPGGGVNGDLTPLSSAASQGQLRAARYLLDHGADVNLRVNGTPLHSAVLKGNKAMVELLLSRGADINARDNGGDTPLHTAVRSGFRAVAETLLDHKADANARNNDRNGQETPLHLAATRANVSMIQLLTAKGADVNAETLNGRTPLSLATYDGNSADAVKTLLDAKADPNAGKLDAPLLGAVQKRNVEVAELLLKAGANPNAISDNDWNVGLFERNIIFNPGTGKPMSATPLWLAAQQGQLALVKLLLQFKADPNDMQTDGQAILFQALQSPEILAALLGAGGNIEARLSNGNIPLLTVASWGGSPNPAVVEMLLKRGANPNATDERGRTPLHYVAEGSGDRKVVELLIANRADPNARDNNGQTPLDVAKGKPYTIAPGVVRMPTKDLADLLRAHGALDDLPKMDRIQVSRPSANYSKMIFLKGTNDWNRFTLLEAIASHYKFIQANLSPPDSSLSFPDLAHVTIHRPVADGKSWKTIPVNVAEIFSSGDCSRNVWLEWGDVIEIPEADHRIGENWLGLPSADAATLIKCVFPMVNIVVQGASKEIKRDIQLSDYSQGSVRTVQPRTSPSFMLRPLLYSSGLIRFSSDLTRVKVTRRDSSGKTREWILDCSENNSPDLWLRDGDVIEVPDKP